MTDEQYTLIANFLGNLQEVRRRAIVADPLCQNDFIQKTIIPYINNMADSFIDAMKERGATDEKLVTALLSGMFERGREAFERDR